MNAYRMTPGDRTGAPFVLLRRLPPAVVAAAGLSLRSRWRRIVHRCGRD